MNIAIVAGNVGQDPELKFTQGGQATLRFSLATNYRVKKGDQWEDRTEWHKILVWGARAEGLAKVISKGSKLTVQGRLHTSQWEKDGQKHYSTEIVAEEVTLQGGSRAEGGQQRSQGERRPAQRPPADDFDDRGYPAPHVGAPAGGDIADNDLPF